MSNIGKRQEGETEWQYHKRCEKQRDAVRQQRYAAEDEARARIGDALVSVTIVLTVRANPYLFEMTREAAQKLMTFLDGSAGDVVRICSERGLGVYQFKAKDVVGMSHHAPNRTMPEVDGVPTPEQVAEAADNQIVQAVGVDDVSFCDGWTL